MTARERITALTAQGETVLSTVQSSNFGDFVSTPELQGWRTRVIHFLRSSPVYVNYLGSFSEIVEGDNFTDVKSGVQILKNLLADLDAGYLEVVVSRNPINIVENICDKFHNVARQLRSRHDSRPTLDVKDEYDVQDLFHSLLRMHFDDVREEEWTPSYAGSSSRTDFLLKDDEIVLEMKMTRASMKAREVADQLIIDIKRYEAHPNCKHLICFVYDPTGLISNPRGVENDLERRTAPFPVQVYIRP